MMNGGRARRRQVDENGGAVAGDGQGFAGGEGTESGAGESERPAIVGVGSSEVVASIDSFFHKAAPVLAPPDGVLVVKFRRRTAHLTAEDGGRKWW